MRNKVSKFLVFFMLTLMLLSEHEILVKANDNYLTNFNEIEATISQSQSRAVGSGLVQFWQVVPEGQNYEGKTTSEIMNQLRCRPNHDLYPISNGLSSHETYINSCYVDDALYLGEDTNYYYVYVSGYHGKVAKNKSHFFELDLDGDGKKYKYEIQTVAYYIPASNKAELHSKSSLVENTNTLDYSSDYLDKYNDWDDNVKSIAYAMGTVQSPSYYINDNGVLYHYITNNVRVANNYSKVIVGPAPSWMNLNVPYYSYDGVYFYYNWREIQITGIGAVNETNPYYNYYQYLPFRSKTNYSASEMDSFTVSNVGNTGKLVNTGQYFEAVEELYGINGSLQYAMGIHESGWGKSSLSINKNNLFGMNAVDNNPYGNGTSFPDVKSGIYYHADRYISWGYTDPIDDYRYYGSHVGNKGGGLNVKYASDPFWGEKIAGWYYRFEQASGVKDYNYYTIGIKTDNSIIDVKSSAKSSATTLYKTYNQKSKLTLRNYPVIILDTVNNYYKIQSDTPINDKGVAQYNAKYNWNQSIGYISSNDSIFLQSAPYYGQIDSPGQYSIVNGEIQIKGWSIYGKEIDRVELYIDGIKEADIPRLYRQDIAEAFPLYDTRQAGYEMTYNTWSLANGEHEIKVITVGKDGTKYIQSTIINVQNIAPYQGNIDYPVNNSEVSGVLYIKGWSIYGKEIDRVELYIDGAKQSNMDHLYRQDVAEAFPLYDTKQAGYELYYNTGMLTNGEHELSIVTIGKDGSKFVQTSLINVQNPYRYHGNIDAPVSDSIVSGEVEIEGWSIYGKEIDRVELYIDGIKEADIPRLYRQDITEAFPLYDTKQAGYKLTYNTWALANGEHEFTVVTTASDGAQYKESIRVTVQNIAPYQGNIDYPANNSEVSGVLYIKGWSIYGKEIDRVELYIDGAKQSNMDHLYRQDVAEAFPLYDTKQAGYELYYNTGMLTNGEHELSIVTIGKDGSKFVQTSLINVQNPYRYHGNIDAPVSDSIVSGEVEIEGWSIYGKEIDRVELYIDGIKEADIPRLYRQDITEAFPLYDTKQAGYKLTYNTWALANGEHEFTVVTTASDGAQYKESIRVTVQNIAPYQGNIDYPANNSEVSGVLYIKGWSIYGKEIDRVELYIDGAKQSNMDHLYRQDVAEAFPLYDTKQAGYELYYNTGMLTNGEHELSIVTIGKDGSKFVQTSLINVQNPVVVLTEDIALETNVYLDDNVIDKGEEDLSIENIYLGELEQPLERETIKDILNIKGWSYDQGIQTIQFYIDGIFQGEIPRVKRPDIEELYPEYLNMDLGYELSYDISSLSEGIHNLEIITIGVDESEKSQALEFIVPN